MQEKPILMVGPELNGAGGVSRVVSIWEANGFFEKTRINYVSSVTGKALIVKMAALLRALVQFGLLLRSARLSYIHTAARTSFYRKSVFINLSDLFHIPILLHVHPAEFQQFVGASRGLKRKYIFSVLSRVKHFVVLSDDMRSGIQSLVPGKKVFVLSNSVCVKEMLSEPVPRPSRRLLYLGWYIREKGVYDLVDAIEILVKRGIQVGVDFYGTMQEERFREYVQRKRLSHLISVNGWINGKAKLHKLYGCTGLVLPSYTEGMPNVILEAMATRTPIIATPVGSLREMLRDRENAVLVEPGNPIDLSEKIKEFVGDAKLRNTIAENGYRDAQVKYDVSIIRQQFNSIMAEVLNGTW